MSERIDPDAFTEFAEVPSEVNDAISKWVQGLLREAFSDFADGYWAQAIDETRLHVLEWWSPAWADVQPVTMTFAPKMLVEAFKTRIRIDEPFHPEDYSHLKDAIAKWRHAVERIEDMVSKTKVRTPPHNE